MNLELKTNSEGELASSLKALCEIMYTVVPLRSPFHILHIV